jgi:hypothetical protein
MLGYTYIACLIISFRLLLHMYFSYVPSLPLQLELCLLRQRISNEELNCFIWRFGLFSGHGLPDILPPTISLPCCDLIIITLNHVSHTVLY